jgi:hypothetical protein
VSGLRDAVRAGLARHGIVAGPDDTPAALRERLNDLYLEDVRRLRDRQKSGEIPLRAYAAAVESLKEGYPLLGLPLPMWSDD